MNTALLTYKSTLLTPEARWLLMQWESQIGLDQPLECSPKGLFARLGLTYAQGRRAWQVLTCKRGKQQEQFVEIERLSRKGPGRYKSRYRLSAKLLKALAKASLPISNCHAEEITTLAKTSRLCGIEEKIDLREGSRRRSTGLTLPNRWLLMVLLAHSDSPGTVTRLSVSALRRLTGMSSFRITNQLKKLSGLGLIAHHQPGRYSSQASARGTSIYLLDLTHPLIRGDNREFINFLYLSSNAEHMRTGLVEGIVDAVIAFGVCSLQMDALFTEYNAIQASGTTSDSNEKGITTKYDPFQLGQKYQEKYTNLRIMLNHAKALLQIKRDLSDDIGKLLKYCDEELLINYVPEDAEWLLTSVHIDTARLLSSAWSELEKGLLGTEQPSHDIIVGTARRLGLDPAYTIEESHDNETRNGSGEDYAPFPRAHDEPASIAPQAKKLSYHPLALLFYALSHYLAKKLQANFKPDSKIDFGAMSYALVPVFTKPPNKQQLLAFKLQGYGNINLDTNIMELVIPLVDPVGENLKTYWQTHHQDCLSAISNEPDDSTPDTPEPADQ
ncbi:hypothetical protein [Vreelandella titanicae]|uniref:hypothetical protein n=1 Tax=Vreelandella titanicae TaxID=664683 RepID=UPI0039BFA18D